MDRRRFIHSALAASAAGTLPWMYGCEASKADRSVAAVSLDGDAIELERSAIRELGESLSGSLLLPEDPDYDTARRIWNGMHDKRPALIARCLGAQDISHAVTFARERELLVAVRGGGHSWPGKSVCDGGIMIDLSHMNAVRVDAGARRAHAQGGTLLYGLDTASREHGLITTAGVVSHTGVGGFTLGGGYGRLNRKFGLAIDNLRSAEIVTADGQVHRISEEAEPDLFWAIRGGGGNFGVVTEFEFELHPFPHDVLSGMVLWPIDQAKDVLEFWAGWQAGLSDDLYVGPVMLTLPDGQAVVAAEIVYAGDPAAGEKEVAPLLRVGKPLDNGVGLNDYMMMQTQEDASSHPGVRSYAKNGMVQEVTQAMVDAMIESFQKDPRIAMFTHTAGGAVNRVDELATAYPHRNAQTMLGFAGVWEEPAEDEEAIAATRAWYDHLEPFMSGGYYQNIENEIDQAAGNYGPAWGRLRQVKGRYDSMNLFRLNSNVTPAA